MTKQGFLRIFPLTVALSTLLLNACGSISTPDPVISQASDAFAPESTHALSQNQAYTAKEFIVTSAHPLASEVGYQVLNDGGNAIDAMVAVQFMLGLVEPQSSGPGGGAFLLYYDASSKQLFSFDGRETAPINAPNDLFIQADQTPMAFFDAVVGGRSVGTPGTVKLLWETHQRFGSKSWESLLTPASETARSGFKVTPRLAAAVGRDQQRLASDPDTYRYFFPSGKALEPGQYLSNPDYADTLLKLAKHGGNYFYSETFAQQIIDKVQSASNAGYLSLEDFANYRVIERAPVCSDFQGHKVCGMGPPSSGAISVAQILGISTHFELPEESAESWHIISEAARLAFADRGIYLADPDFYPPPSGLLAPNYLRTRTSLIDPSHAMASATPGKPKGLETTSRGAGIDISQASTSHFVIIDKAGNIVSMTTTIENGFGSRLMAHGFLLNNELTDFSFRQEHDGALIANRVEPGKRPRSSMAPTIVFKDGKPRYALGSPGGSRIINYVANTLIRLIQWKIPLQEAFDRPHIVKRFGSLDLEPGAETDTLAKQLKSLGHEVKLRDLNSGLHGVSIHYLDDGSVEYIGAADKRREGKVLGK